jgi:Protein of unknown function DUF262
MSLIPIARRSKYMARPSGNLELFEPIPSEQYDSEVSLQGYEILSYPADFTLEVLVGKWKKEEIKIPPLQRRFIWSQLRASKLIESFLMGLPVPPVFFYQERGTNKLLVVDGNSDLLAIGFPKLARKKINDRPQRGRYLSFLQDCLSEAPVLRPHMKSSGMPTRKHSIS